jgi:fructose-1,6-bisphosphatase
VLGMEEKLFYSDLKEKCEMVKKIWSEEKENLLIFLEKSIDYINNINPSR